MAIIKKISLQEIQWLIPSINAGTQATTRVSQLLGEYSSCFATCNIASLYYIWSSEEADWKPINEASSAVDKNLITAAMSQLHEAVTNKLPNWAEKLLTVPSEEYIFYKISEFGTARLLMTGWGFRSYRSHTASAFTIPKYNKRECVRIKFLQGGHPIANYPFEIICPAKNNALVTDDSGVCNLGEYFAAGTSFEINAPLANKHFTLTVEPGKNDYVYDVSSSANIGVKVTQNGQPVANECVKIEVGEEQYQLITDDNGQSNISLVYYPDAICCAKVRDEEKSARFDQDGCSFAFDFIVEEPVIVYQCTVVVKVTKSGLPCPNENIKVEYAKNQYLLTTNADGEASIVVDRVPGEECCVSLNEDHQQSCELTTDIAEFCFELEDVAIIPHIVVKDIDNNDVPNYPIQVVYEQTQEDYVTNEDGRVYLGEMLSGKTMQVIDGLDPSHTQTYQLVENQDEYIFTIPFSSSEQYRDIKISAFDIKKRPFAGNRVAFRQGDKTILSTFDSQGATYLSNDTFKRDEPLTAEIITHDNKFAPISFTLEQNENEYELYEKKGGRPWWRILLEILVLLALVALFAYLATVFGTLFNHLNNWVL